MKVSELATAANISRDTVRHYMRIGLIKAEKDKMNGYHYFTKKSLERIQFIKLAQGLGFKLQDIQLIFDHAQQGNSPCAQVRTLIQQRLTESEQKILELTNLFKRMQKALTEWQAMPDGVPNGDSICQLIESQNIEVSVDSIDPNIRKKHDE